MTQLSKQILLIASISITLSLLFCSCSVHSQHVRTYQMWLAEFENGGITLKQDTIIPYPSAPKDVVNIVNKTRGYSKPNVVFQSYANDTLYVTLDNPYAYTEQLGSTGAAMFLVSTVYNLTGHDSIKYVYLDVPIGSHGKPGLFSKDLVANLIKAK